jgi:hypothetical protein
VTYLRSPRLHFMGRFQADTSTVNNDVRHFDEDQFRDEFQKPMEIENQKIVKYNGYWNPEGTGAWRLLGCKVTSAVLDGQILAGKQDDPVIGMLIGGSKDRVAGKLVDLDPQQQMVSQIWGLAIRLHDDRGIDAFDSEFHVAPFCDIWLRQQSADQWFDQLLAAAYQSVLTGVKWQHFGHSRFLRALKDASIDGLLSLRMNVFGYDRTPSAPDYSTGVAVGTIGPYAANEPKHFVMGRQLTAAISSGPNGFPFVPANQISNIQAEVNESTRSISADFGNALPTSESSGKLQDVGSLVFAILKDPGAKQGDVLDAQMVIVLGHIPYRNPDWFFQTAGVQDFPFANIAGATDLIGDHPLAVVQENGQKYTVFNRETADGVYVRADCFVFRLNPGESANVDFYASRYGKPLATTIVPAPTVGFMGGAGTSADLSIKVPDVNVPSGIIAFKTEIETQINGHGSLTISASPQGPGNPREYIDGQLYGIAYQFKKVPANFNANPFNYISILAWDKFDVPDRPTWFQHILPILTLYGNLYPIMSRRLVNLRDYDSVVANRDIMKLSFSLPLDNPNSMPVTRDLSANKRRTILKWLDSKDPQTGLPPRGETPAPKATASLGVSEGAGNQPDFGGKSDFLRQALKSRKKQGGDHAED